MRSSARISVFFAVCAGLLGALALTSHASDDPHDVTYLPPVPPSNGVCENCHALHVGPGAQLTNAASNVALCQSCHTLTGTASKLPVEKLIQSNLLSEAGDSHNFGVTATNTNAGASVPTNPEMSVRLVQPGNIIVCSTCHNQHSSPASATDSGIVRIGSVARIAGTGSGTITPAVSGAPAQKGYIVKIVAGGAAGTATFQVSNDNEVSYFATQSTGTGITLNGSTGVTATFSGAFVAGDKYRFYVGYPFLRLPLDSGTNAAGAKFCRDCHASWVMDHSGTETWTGAVRSHPVGIPLNVTNNSYDRTSATILDGNGTVQSGAGDGNPYNNLKLDPAGNVQCYTCHDAHFAPGNTNSAHP